jgi:hypothetical protein
LITVALLVGVGVGEGEGTVPGVGVGVGFDDDTELAEFEEEPFPPQDVTIRDRAKITMQACAVRQILMEPPEKKSFFLAVRGATVNRERTSWITLKT